MNLKLRLVQVTNEAVSMYFFNIVIWLQGFESKVCVCDGGEGGDFTINAR